MYVILKRFITECFEKEEKVINLTFPFFTANISKIKWAPNVNYEH